MLRQGLAKDGQLRRDQFDRFSSLLCHPTQSKIITGTSSGSALLWDLRQADSVWSDRQIHNDSVRDIASHPRLHDCYITCSNDGTVKSCSIHSDKSKYTSSNGMNIENIERGGKPFSNFCKDHCV